MTLHASHLLHMSYLSCYPFASYRAIASSPLGLPYVLRVVLVVFGKQIVRVARVGGMCDGICQSELRATRHAYLLLCLFLIA